MHIVHWNVTHKVKIVYVKKYWITNDTFFSCLVMSGFSAIWVTMFCIFSVDLASEFLLAKGHTVLLRDVVLLSGLYSDPFAKQYSQGKELAWFKQHLAIARFGLSPKKALIFKPFSCNSSTISCKCKFETNWYLLKGRRIRMGYILRQPSIFIEKTSREVDVDLVSETPSQLNWMVVACSWVVFSHLNEWSLRMSEIWNRKIILVVVSKV